MAIILGAFTKKDNPMNYKHVLMAGLLLFMTIVTGSVRASSHGGVRFGLIQGYVIVVPVVINGVGPFDFILDTGTTTTVIDREMAAQLELQAKDRLELITMAGTRALPRSWLHSLAVGTLSEENVEVVWMELRAEQSVSPKIRGLLGQGFLSKVNYLIDYRAKLLRFESAGDMEYRLAGTRLKTELQDGKIVIRTDDKRPLGLSLDSGAPVTLIFNSPSGKAGADIYKLDTVSAKISSGRGSREAYMGLLKRLRIGNKTFLDLPVALVRIPDGSEGAAQDGVLPTNLFSAIYVNNEKDFVILNPRFHQ